MTKTFTVPQKLQTRGVYYGWIVLFVGTLGVMMSVPGQTVGVSVFTNDLISSLRVSRVHLALAYMLGTLGSAMILPLAGKLLQNSGARVLSVLACLGLSVFLLLLSWSDLLTRSVQEVTGFEFSKVGFVVAFICFLGVRHFGQGQLTMACRTMLGLWFEKRRGLVLGISGAFVGFSFGVAPLVLNDLISFLGWRESLRALSCALLGMALVAAGLFRKSPESCGLKVDGGLLEGFDVKQKQDSEALDPHSLRLAEAVKTFAFWAFNLGILAQAFIVTAMTFHMTDIASTLNMDADVAYSVFLPLSVTAISSEIFFGFLSDRIPIKYLLIVMQSFMFIGVMSLAYLNETWGFALTAVGLGVSSGLFALLNGLAWPNLFGRAYLGEIMGLVTSCMVAGSAVGPYLFGLVKSSTGGYLLATQISGVVPLIIFAMAFAVKNPRKVLQTEKKS